ncbi:SLC13 family permease [Nocardioides albus]|uniref:Anion transporter n=1 Tax=Nocardioides albus TaxID=1841 RepID=A0A7W5A6B2_9ACTN|nr:SLC13 family permease [Nocardioides albus]MBB3090215.1 anion transporter [Nocardioides albus]GGU28553.1 transporter [Nocardioides albus]
MSSTAQVVAGAAVVAVAGTYAWHAGHRSADPPSVPALLTLIVFGAAVWAWMGSGLDDTYVSLAAVLALIVVGVLPAEELFAALGSELIWLMLGAFVMAAGIARTGLATRAAVALAVRARSPRQLVHLLTVGLVVTAYVVPSTSARAVLAVPVFVALAAVLAARPRLVKALALLFPTVILLSAVGSLLGAGAHLLTSQILAAATGTGIGYVGWLLLGLPLAVVSSHLAAELLLRMFTTREDRATAVRITPDDFVYERWSSLSRPTGPLSTVQLRALVVLAGTVALWVSEPLHGISPAVVALLGALAVAAPRHGVIAIGPALKEVPWSLLLFLAATLALGAALIDSGAAAWLAGRVLEPLSAAPPVVFLTVVVLLSTALHLVVQSRSARSSVLVPIVVALAPAAGLAPAAAAFASTAAAGFCHTLPASAKPVSVFARVDGIDTYDRSDLLRLSRVLMPLHAALVLAFALWVWPHLGLPLT